MTTETPPSIAIEFTHYALSEPCQAHLVLSEATLQTYLKQIGQTGMSDFLPRECLQTNNSQIVARWMTHSDMSYPMLQLDISPDDPQSPSLRQVLPSAQHGKFNIDPVAMIRSGDLPGFRVLTRSLMTLPADQTGNPHGNGDLLMYYAYKHKRPAFIRELLHMGFHPDMERFRTFANKDDDAAIFVASIIREHELNADERNNDQSAIDHKPARPRL